MISIVIPLYNKSNYIEKCIQSVIQQTYQNFELLIINDGSTDDSLLKLEQFLDKRIRVIDQKNAGVSTARNKGVLLATYEYIAFLDADDWWHPNFLTELISLIRVFPDAILYGCNYFYVKRGFKRIEPKGLPVNFTSDYIDYVTLYSSTFCAPINCSFVVVRKSAFLMVGGFRSFLKLGEDFDLWVRLALLGKVAYANIPLAYSNQDVELSNRAIGGYRLFNPESHFIFNLAYLKPTEQHSVPLKKLLDGLRVRALLPYYLSGVYKAAVNPILKEVDFSKQPVFFRGVYHSPLSVVRLYFGLMRVGSTTKQSLLRLLR